MYHLTGLKYLPCVRESSLGIVAKKARETSCTFQIHLDAYLLKMSIMGYK